MWVHFNILNVPCGGFPIASELRAPGVLKIADAIVANNKNIMVIVSVSFFFFECVPCAGNSVLCFPYAILCYFSLFLSLSLHPFL